MTDYEYRGHTATTYPSFQNPERGSVLQVEPNEIIDFGEASPPLDGQWYDSAGNQMLPAEPEPDSTDSVETNPGTGDGDQDEEIKEK